jgi:hypothetical protein
MPSGQSAPPSSAPSGTAHPVTSPLTDHPEDLGVVPIGSAAATGDACSAADLAVSAPAPRPVPDGTDRDRLEVDDGRSRCRQRGLHQEEDARRCSHPGPMRAAIVKHGVVLFARPWGRRSLALVDGAGPHRLSIHGLQGVFRRVAGRCGLAEKVHPHTRDVPWPPRC